MKLNNLIRYTILGTIAGVILAFNMYHADYKLLIAQVGTIALAAMWGIKRIVAAASYAAPLAAQGAATTVFLLVCILSFIFSPNKLASGQELYKVGTWVIFGIVVAAASYAATSVKLAAQGAAATAEVKLAPQGGAATCKAAQGAAATALIIIAALTAIYFTFKPYINIQQVKEQEFFIKETMSLDKKIQALENKELNDKADYFFSLGVLYAKKKDFEKAKEYFIKTLKENPKYAGAFNNLGNIAFVQGDEIKGREFFYNAVRFEPDNVEYLLNLAYADFKANNLSSAMDSVEKALSIDPENSRALLLQRQITE